MVATVEAPQMPPGLDLPTQMPEKCPFSVAGVVTDWRFSGKKREKQEKRGKQHTNKALNLV